MRVLKRMRTVTLGHPHILTHTLTDRPMHTHTHTHTHILSMHRHKDTHTLSMHRPKDTHTQTHIHIHTHTHTHTLTWAVGGGLVYWAGSICDDVWGLWHRDARTRTLERNLAVNRCMEAARSPTHIYTCTYICIVMHHACVHTHMHTLSLTYADAVG
jgi:hypothetical protein